MADEPLQLICPRCSSAYQLTDEGQRSSTCPDCGLELFVSESQSRAESSPLHGTSETAPWSPGMSGHEPAQSDGHPMLEAVPRKLGRYDILDYLGGGGFARVYLAKDTELDRLVAMKVPRSDRFQSEAALDRFFEEARMVAQLEHPGIVQVYDVGTDEGIRYIVSQYIRGKTLTQRLALSSIPYTESAEIMRQCADAIQFAHKRQFFHRDLKPGNILLDESGKSFVADFGLAVHRTQQGQHAGEVAGTLQFMSPEQIVGDAHLLDGRSDIWSLGVILYTMLTARLPFEGDFDALVTEITERNPLPPRQLDERIPEQLQAACLKCLEKNPTDRYSTAWDLAESLQNWLSTVQSDAVVTASSAPTVMYGRPDSSTGQVARTDRKPRSNQTLLLLVILAGVAALTASFAATRPENDEPFGPLRKMPFRFDDSITLDRWYPLLEDKPTELFPRPSGKQSDWFYDGERQAIQIDSPGSRFLLLGETDSADFRLSFAVNRNVWSGSIGLFWGFQEAEWRSGEIVPQCHYVDLYGYPKNNSHVVAVKYGRVWCQTGEGRPPTTNTSQLGQHRIEHPGVSEQHLELRIVNGKLITASLNGEEMPDLLMHAESRGLPGLAPSGQFGIVSGKGASTIRDARIRVLSYKRSSE